MATWNDEDEDEEEDEDEIDDEELRRQIVASLEYLIAEGMVVQVGDRYRLKTKKEIRKELKDIENGLI